MTDRRDPTYLDALAQLRHLFEEARARGLTEPQAASLATANLRGQPSIRMITVVAIEEVGPVFFVDERSGKGRQLHGNPCAALCFFWPELHRQVVIEGHAETAGSAESDRLWADRPRERQLAAWIAAPEVRDRHDSADAALAAVRDHFASRPVPRPPHWHALYLGPDAMLFWKTGWHHLHPRVRYFRARSGPWRRESMTPL